MSYQYWTSLTAPEGTSSGGLLPKDSLVPLNPNQFDFRDIGEPEETWFPRYFQGTVNSPGGIYTLTVQDGDSNLYNRLLGCLLMIILPEDGIGEALDDLRSIYDYYRPLPPAKFRSLEVQSPGEGTIIGHSERGAMVINE